MKRKVWDITVKDNPNRVVMGENDEFYTTDTEAYLVFNLEDKNFNPATAVLTLENRNDGSLKNETVDVVDGLIEWEMPQRYIEHFGNWQGQLVYEDIKDGQPELYTSATFTFVVNAHIGDKKKPSLVEIENWEKFIRDGTELIETWEDMEDLRQANEAQRQANYQELLDTGVLQTNINTKLEQLEEEYAPKLTEVTTQLAQTGYYTTHTKIQTNKKNYTLPFNATSEVFDYFPFIPTYESDGDWLVEDGVITPTFTTAPKYGTFSLLKNESIADGKISVLINNWTKSTRTSYFGIVFKAKNENEYLMATFDNENERVSINRRANGATQGIADRIISANVNRSLEGEPILLSVEFIGGNVELFINNASVLKINQNETIRNMESTGKFGLLTVSPNNATINEGLTFSNLTYSKYLFNRIDGNIKKGLAIGDSITFGSNSSVPSLSWLGLLRSYLQESIVDFELDNEAVGGIMSNTVTQRLIDKIDNKPYDFALIMSGINDSRADTGLTLDESIKQTRRAIRLCKEKGVTPIILNTTAIHPSVDRTTVNRTSWNYLKELRQRKKRLCANEQVILIDTDEVLNVDSDLDEDMVHPLDSGHRKIFEKITNELF